MKFLIVFPSPIITLRYIEIRFILLTVNELGGKKNRAQTKIIKTHRFIDIITRDLNIHSEQFSENQTWKFRITSPPNFTSQTQQ